MRLMRLLGMGLRAFVARHVRALALGPFLMAAHIAAASDHDAMMPLEDSLEAFGGRAALLDVETVRIEEKVLNFEPFQRLESRGAPRQVSSEHTHVVWWPAGGAFDIDRSLETYHPALERRSYRIIHANGLGLRTGEDGSGVNEAPLTAARMAAELKQLWITNPGLMMAHAFDSAVRVDDRMFGGRMYPTYRFDHASAKWIVVINPDSRFPWLVETQEFDPQLGVVRHVYRMGEWTEIDGAVFPFKLGQYLIPAAHEASVRHDEFLVRRVLRTEIEVGAAGNAASPAATQELRALAEQQFKDSGVDRAHLYLRHASMAEPIDEDRSRVELHEAGEGIYHVLGQRYHNLLIVGPASIALVNAPLYASRTENLLAEAHRRWPDKPIRHLILTHHHSSDTGGLRPLIAQGVQVMLPKADLEFFQRVFGQLTEVPDLVTVWQKGRLPGFERPVFVYDVPNSQAYDMLMVHIPDEKFLFSPLLYVPGAESQTFRHARALIGAIDFYGPPVSTIVGGRGRAAVTMEMLRGAVDRSGR